MFFEIQGLFTVHDSFTTCKGGAMYMVFLKNSSLYYKKLKFKMSKCLGVTWNCEHVLKQNTKSSKIYAFGNFDIYSRMINTYHMTY